jgi:hypothetical protein
MGVAPDFLFKHTLLSCCRHERKKTHPFNFEIMDKSEITSLPDGFCDAGILVMVDGSIAQVISVMQE